MGFARAALPLLLAAALSGACAAEQDGVATAALAATPPRAPSSSLARAAASSAGDEPRLAAMPRAASSSAASDTSGGPAGALEGAIPYDAIRGCYTDAQERDPLARGRLEVRAKIAADGSVASAQVVSMTGSLSTVVVSCVVERLQATRFPAPDAGHDTLLLPIDFEPKP